MMEPEQKKEVCHSTFNAMFAATMIAFIVIIVAVVLSIFSPTNQAIACGLTGAAVAFCYLVIAPKIYRIEERAE